MHDITSFVMLAASTCLCVRVTWLLYVEWHDSPSYAWRDTFKCVTSLYLQCQPLQRVYVYVWRDSFMCATWLSFKCVTWQVESASRLLHVGDTTYSHLLHDSFIGVAWLLYTCDMTHSRVWHVWHDWFIHVWHESFICVAWLFHMCDMPPSYMWHDCGITGLTVRCSVLLWVGVCCSALQCVAVCWSTVGSILNTQGPLAHQSRRCGTTQGLISSADIGLHIGLICKYLGLFDKFTGLLCRFIGLLESYRGLFRWAWALFAYQHVCPADIRALFQIHRALLHANGLFWAQWALVHTLLKETRKRRGTYMLVCEKSPVFIYARALFNKWPDHYMLRRSG